MLITSYYPIIYAKDLDAMVKKYTEELGFKHLHSVNLCNDNFINRTLELESGNRIDLFSSKGASEFPDGGFAGMRVNVSDFQEGLNYFRRNHFQIISGPRTEPFAEIALMKNSVSGMRIFLYHHIKKHD